MQINKMHCQNSTGCFNHIRNNTNYSFCCKIYTNVNPISIKVCLITIK